MLYKKQRKTSVNYLEPVYLNLLESTEVYTTVKTYEDKINFLTNSLFELIKFIEMVYINLVSFIIYLGFQSLVEAKTGSCYYERSLGLGGSTNIDHRSSYGNCTYKAFAPVDTFLQVSCNVSLQDNSCNNQRLTISRIGERDLRDGRNYCVSGLYNFQSIGNEIVISFTSNWANYGSFFCKVSVITPTNANCDCGWNVGTKIVGGTQTGVNEFVSHAGLVDSGTRNVFCGATISELKELKLTRFFFYFY